VQQEKKRKKGNQAKERNSRGVPAKKVKPEEKDMVLTDKNSTLFLAHGLSVVVVVVFGDKRGFASQVDQIETRPLQGQAMCGPWGESHGGVC